MKDKQKDENREYLERIPFVSELLHRIGDISEAIKQGKSGYVESRNLITDLPKSMRQGSVNDDLIAYKKEYDAEKERLTKLYVTGTPESYKRYVDSMILNAGQEYSCNVKEYIINLLDSKGLLFLSRKAVPESGFVDFSGTRDDPLAD